MMEGALLDLTSEALRVLFVLCAPLLCAAVVASVLSGIVMLVTSLQDATFAYGVRLLACVLVCGSMFATFSQALMQLLVSALE